MKIVRIEMLFLIWALPVLLLFFLYGMHRRRGILHRFASEKGQGAIVAGTSHGPRWLKAALVLASLFWAAVALSGPQYGFRWQEIERKGIDIIIALDCSRSMLARDISPTRLDRAKREVYDLLGLLQGDRIGLVAFAGTAFLQCPLTLDYGAFHLFLESLAPESLPVGGSDISAAVAASQSAFDARGSREKAVILITDGEDTGVSGDPLKAAEAARSAGVTLFCIGVGTREGVPVNDPGGGFLKDRAGKIVVSRLAEETLRQMTAATGGTYVASTAGDMDLDAIYTRDIRGRMEMETLQGGRKQVWEDRYQWALFLAVAALMAEMCLPSRKKAGGGAGWMILMLIILNSPAAAHADALRDGVSAYRQEDFEGALKHFIDAQLDAPDDPEIRYNIGSAYYRLGDFDAAAKSLEGAAASEDRAVRRDALFNLGNANFRRQDVKRAIENYEAVLKMAPDDRDAAENLEFAKKVLAAQQKQQAAQNAPAPPKDGPQAKPDTGEPASP
ncbi:VWA domain-containing protein, partial [Desulfococcus sp.]|uniref:VWA domain-containing protein n=1 Tax=Desulfococcus sp. TaxID=2025834 RepID=UPI003592EC52